MSEARFTPGPWNLTGKTGDGKRIFIEQEGDGWHRLFVEVCSDDCDSGTAMKNAQLIAAAPDFYAACEAMIEWDDRENDHAVPFDHRMELCRRAFELARAAIAKATT